MATSDVQICNLALSRIGSKATIDSLDEDTEEARACSTVYSHVRDAVLEAWAWPFATRRANLALLADEDWEEWEYAYALPADCIAPRYLWTGVSNPGPAESTPFEIEAHTTTDTKVLLTNQEDAVLVYTTAVTNPVMFPPNFVLALAWALAAELVLALPLRPELEPTIRLRYEAALASARAQSQKQRQFGAATDSSFVTGRG